MHDLLIIGGGINGAGIAADAAGRGLDVVLCEKADLASATSSWSTKLIHGGLRYLEFYEFSLVRKSLQEREVLTAAAAHIIKPIAFHIPQLPHSRSSWLIRVGLFLYDNLARRKRFGGSRSIKIDPEGPLSSAITRGFEYWDAQVDDSRLVVLNVLQAKRRGAQILTRTECTGMKSLDNGWRVTLHDHASNTDSEVDFKVIVNATGPWVADLSEKLKNETAEHEIRLVKGSHIVVPRIHTASKAFMLQHHDGRVIFVIPWLQDYTLIGTTEAEHKGSLERVEISEEEISYLLSIVNLYFKKSILRSDIVYSFAGVRPLIDDEEVIASKVSRDYNLVLEANPHPILSVYGGKVTTYRVLAEDVLSRLKEALPAMGPAWTKGATLPGGDFDLSEHLFQKMASNYAWLSTGLINRWLDSYGTLSFDMLGDASGVSDLGVNFGHNLYQREVDYLCTKEWAKSADDILWRRSKLGLKFSCAEHDSLANYIEQSFPAN
jgi:glycerol-3-phosphate dehydrogenase